VELSELGGAIALIAPLATRLPTGTDKYTYVQNLILVFWFLPFLIHGH